MSNKDCVEGVRIVSINQNDYKIYGVRINDEVYPVAEYKLNAIIEDAIDSGCYSGIIRDVDELYEFYLPEDNMSDDDIVESIRDIVMYE